MPWTAKFTENLRDQALVSIKKESIRVALIFVKNEIENAESLRDMPSLGETLFKSSAFFVGGMTILCIINEKDRIITLDRIVF